MLFGSNMALRASAWHQIVNEVCRDGDVMQRGYRHFLHLMGKDLKTVYSPRMIAAMSARRMDTSLSSFLSYMRRFKNTFDAHPPQHTRTHKPGGVVHRHVSGDAYVLPGVAESAEFRGYQSG